MLYVLLEFIWAMEWLSTSRMLRIYLAHCKAYLWIVSKATMKLSKNLVETLMKSKYFPSDEMKYAKVLGPVSRSHRPLSNPVLSTDSTGRNSPLNPFKLIEGKCMLLVLIAHRNLLLVFA